MHSMLNHNRFFQKLNFKNENTSLFEKLSNGDVRKDYDEFQQNKNEKYTELKQIPVHENSLYQIKYYFFKGSTSTDKNITLNLFLIRKPSEESSASEILSKKRKHEEVENGSISKRLCILQENESFHEDISEISFDDSGIESDTTEYDDENEPSSGQSDTTSHTTEHDDDSTYEPSSGENDTTSDTSSEMMSLSFRI